MFIWGVIMANDDFNVGMDNYLRKIRKKRTDPIDYSTGKAKVSDKNSEEIADLPDDEIIIEEKDIGGIKKFFLSIFRRKKVGDEVEFETYEQEIPAEEAKEIIENVSGEFDEEFGEMENDNYSFFGSLFSWLRPRKLSVNDEFDEEELEDKIAQKNSQVLKDAKIVFKAVNHWLDQLEPAKKKEFKNSEDFIAYTEFLKKYKLIRD